MKVISYQYCNRVNRGTEEKPMWEDILFEKKIICSADMLEANEEIAKREAHNGKYTIAEEEATT